MPYVELKTSAACPEALAASLRVATARALRVSDTWVLVHISGDQRVFASEQGHAAHVDIRVEGALSATLAETLFGVVTALIEREIGVPPTACFVHILEVPRQHCGWNGQVM